MSRHTQAIQDTKAGTLNSSTVETQANNDDKIVTPRDLNEFLSNIQLYKRPGNEPLAEIETTRKIIEHFNPGKKILGFEEAGYFVHDGVKVFEQGKKHSRDSMTMEEKLFPKKP